MHDLLFADQTVLGTADGLISRAQLLGLDIVRFTECMNTNRYAENIRRSARGAERMGLEGTPTFLLGGHRTSDRSPVASGPKAQRKLVQPHAGAASLNGRLLHNGHATVIVAISGPHEIALN
jgi:predicted DsbA family dithiol-disulfide isomerase